MKRTLALIMALIMIFALCACGKEAAPAATPAAAPAAEAAPAVDPVELSFGTIYADTTVTGMTALKFKELIEEKSNGAITVAIYPSSQLGTEQELVESCSMGALDITIPATGICGNFAKSLQIFTLPYVIDGWAQLDKVMNGEIGDDLVAQFEGATDAKVLARNWYRQPRSLYGTKKLDSIADLAGFRVRVPENTTYVEGWKALGASPVSVTLSEVYSALQTGAVDGAETTIDSFVSNGYYSVCKYYYMTNHVHEANWLLMNENKFNSFSPELQQVILDCAFEAGQYHQQLVTEGLQAKYDQITAEGVEIIDIDRAEWIAKMDGVAEKVWEVWGDEELFGRIRALA